LSYPVVRGGEVLCRSQPPRQAQTNHCPWAPADTAVILLRMPEGPPSPAWFSRLRGRFIVFDGPDGSGKTTQFKQTRRRLIEAGLEVCEVREPGATDIGEQIRDMLLDIKNKDSINLACEMLLFMASRAQLVAERIRPALAAGEVVMADRFISSTLAYQGTAGGLPVQAIRATGDIALGDTWPDLVVVFDVDQETAAKRLTPLLDRMEQKGAEYHAKVRQGYLDQAEHDPNHYAVIDARQAPEDVHAALLETLENRSKIWSPHPSPSP